MSKIILKGHIVVPDFDLALVHTELRKHIELTEREEGCLVFRVSQDSNKPTIFHVYEEFISKEAFEIHQKRVKNSSWGNATVNVERHYNISEE